MATVVLTAISGSQCSLRDKKKLLQCQQGRWPDVSSGSEVTPALDPRPRRAGLRGAAEAGWGVAARARAAGCSGTSETGSACGEACVTAAAPLPARGGWQAAGGHR